MTRRERGGGVPHDAVPDMTEHAWVRWGERLPDFDLKLEWLSAHTPSIRTMKYIRRNNPGHEVSTTFRGKYYLASKNVIFVMAPGYVVITVFPTAKAVRAINQRKKHEEKSNTEGGGV